MGIFPCVILVRQSLSYSSSAELGSPVSSTDQTGMLFHKFKPMFEADKNHAKEKAPSCEDGLPVRLSSGRKSRYSWLWDNRPRCTKGKPDTFKVPPTRRCYKFLLSYWPWELAPRSLLAKISACHFRALSAESTQKNDGGLQCGSEQLRTDKRVEGNFQEFCAGETWRSRCCGSADEPATGLPQVLCRPPVR